MFASSQDISLRATEPDDAATIYKWENDRKIWRVSETYFPYSYYQIEQLIINNDLFSMKQARMMITDNKNGLPIGCIDIYDFDPIHLRAGIGILLEKGHRKKGLARQSLELLLDYCFNTLILKQVFCLIEIDNIDSIKLFESVGFVQCGHRKEWIRTPEGFTDELEYQYINKNFK